MSAVYSGANETDSEWRTLASHELGIARLDIRARKCPPAGDSHTIEYEYAVVMDGDVLTREIVNQTLYLTEHQTLLRLLLQWGLEPKAVFADWNGSAFTPSDRSAIIVAESTARE